MPDNLRSRREPPSGHVFLDSLNESEIRLEFKKQLNGDPTLDHFPSRFFKVRLPASSVDFFLEQVYRTPVSKHSTMPLRDAVCSVLKHYSVSAPEQPWDWRMYVLEPVFACRELT